MKYTFEELNGGKQSITTQKYDLKYGVGLIPSNKSSVTNEDIIDRMVITPEDGFLRIEYAPGIKRKTTDGNLVSEKEPKKVFKSILPGGIASHMSRKIEAGDEFKYELTDDFLVEGKKSDSFYEVSFSRPKWHKMSDHRFSLTIASTAKESKHNIHTPREEIDNLENILRSYRK